MYFRIIILLIVFPVTTVFAQQNFSLLELAGKIFGPDSTFDKMPYSAGGYDGIPDGRYISPAYAKKFRILTQDDSMTVVNMTLVDAFGKGVERYLYFKKYDIWKMINYRYLAISDWIEEYLNNVDRLTPKQIDSIVSTEISREQLNAIVSNQRLIIDFDDNIIAHFNKHKVAFNQLKDSLFIAALRGEDSIPPTYKKLLLTRLDIKDQCLKLIIGGFYGNDVGYLFVKDKKDLPLVDLTNIMMLREIGDGWYLYKT